MRAHLSLYWLLPLALLLSSPVTSSRLKARGPCFSCDKDDDGNCIPDNLDDQNDGIIEDGTAGIGFEFECAEIELQPESDCSTEEMVKSKGKRIAGRSGTNWELTADTTIDKALDSEYIIDGKAVKLGSGDLKRAALEVASDIANWDPHFGIGGIEIDQSTCNNWKITKPPNAGDFAKHKWAPQVTAPMPLEGIQELFRKGRLEHKDEPSHLLPEKGRPQKDMSHVTKDFFQASPGGLSGDALKDDTLGFFSLVLSYAKADKTPYDDDPDSVKVITSIMPRNDFTSMYGLLKDQGVVPPFEGSLFDLFKVLACYKNTDDGTVEFDTDFCHGDASNPEPIDGKLENMKYARGDDSCTMKEWIDAIEAGGDGPDPLSRVDKQVDGSVGHFGNKWEKLLNTDRQVPIFEFRRLSGIKADEFGKKVEDVENEIIKMHGDYANAPRKIRRSEDAKYSHIARNAPRDDCPGPTPTSGASTTAPPPTPAPTIGCTIQLEDPDKGINQMGCICGSTTLPLLTITGATDMSQSCSYTAFPTNSVANPISIETQTFISNCYACTLVGGFADTPTCASKPVDGCTPTTPAVPTATVFISNNTIPIGDENNKNSGADLRNEVFQKLKALCPDNASACDSKTKAEIDSIKTVVDHEAGVETLKFTIQDSSYSSTRERDQLLAAAVASWQAAVGKSCKEVEYEEPEEATSSGCGHGIVRRGTPERALMSLEERRLRPRNALPAPVCDNCGPVRTPECKYKATVCAGPDHITSLLANATNPYANHMNIQLELSLGQGNSAFNEFICEIIVDGLTALAMAFAPELAGAEVWEDLELQTLCEGLAAHFGSRDANITENALLIGA